MLYKIEYYLTPSKGQKLLVGKYTELEKMQKYYKYISIRQFKKFL